jgi:hypothetical protein
MALRSLGYEEKSETGIPWRDAFPAEFSENEGGITCLAFPIVIRKKLLRSDAFRQLNGTAKTVYFDFLMKCRVKGQKPKAGRKTA